MLILFFLQKAEKYFSDIVKSLGIHLNSSMHQNTIISVYGNVKSLSSLDFSHSYLPHIITQWRTKLAHKIKQWNVMWIEPECMSSDKKSVSHFYKKSIIASSRKNQKITCLK